MNTYTELIGPLYGNVGGLPVVVVGVLGDLWVYLDDDGSIHTCAMQALQVDMRFRDGQWHDVSPTVLPPGEELE